MTSKFLRSLLGLLLLPHLALAAVAVNGTPAIDGNTTGGTTHSFSYAVTAGSNCLAVVETSNASSFVTITPSAITYNGVSLTIVPGSALEPSPYGVEISIWYLVSPPTGSSDTLTVTYPNAFLQSTISVIGLSGCNTSSPVGTAATSESNNTTSAAVTATGGGSGDLYIGGMYNDATPPITSNGTGQTNLVNLLTSPFYTYVDDIPGSDAGAFVWGFSNGGFLTLASAVDFKAAAGGSSFAPMFLAQ